MDINIIIVDKNGTLKCVNFKNFDEQNIYKKCNLKKSDDFELKTTWEINIDKNKLYVDLYAKEKGRAGNENKYDFPPPVDTVLYYGSCALVLKDNKKKCINLSVDKWELIYEKLFGGFENLDKNALEDEDEDDELEEIPLELKTKNGGYMKDDFVVDDDDEENEDGDVEDDDELSEELSWNDNNDDETLIISDDEDDEMFDELGSELSEEQYDYSDED